MVIKFVDSTLGMMYGTVLSPLLILIGYDVKSVVPAILISQAVGGFIASYKHHRLKNANFQTGTIVTASRLQSSWLVYLPALSLSLFPYQSRRKF